MQTPPAKPTHSPRSNPKLLDFPFSSFWLPFQALVTILRGLPGCSVMYSLSLMPPPRMLSKISLLVLPASLTSTQQTTFYPRLPRFPLPEASKVPNLSALLVFAHILINWPSRFLLSLFLKLRIRTLRGDSVFPDKALRLLGDIYHLPPRILQGLQ